MADFGLKKRVGGLERETCTKSFAVLIIASVIINKP